MSCSCQQPTNNKITGRTKSRAMTGHWREAIFQFITCTSQRILSLKTFARCNFLLWEF